MFRIAFGIAGLVAAGALLSACQQGGAGGHASSQLPAAASQANTCYRLTSTPGQPAAFTALVYDEPNLETCAVHLEGWRLEHGMDAISGVWNGVYIYASGKEIDSATAPGAARYPVFSPDQQGQIDQSLQQQLAQARAASSKGASSAP